MRQNTDVVGSGFRCVSARPARCRISLIGQHRCARIAKKSPCTSRLPVILWLFLCWLPAAHADNITYGYDALARVIEAADATTNQAVVYSYDAAGNITSRTVTALTTLGVAGFAPAQGPVGSQVTISGTGFSTTASANTVQFNGAIPVVNSATATMLIVTVPSATTTGNLVVTCSASRAREHDRTLTRKLVSYP